MLNYGNFGVKVVWCIFASISFKGFTLASCYLSLNFDCLNNTKKIKMNITGHLIHFFFYSYFYNDFKQYCVIFNCTSEEQKVLLVLLCQRKGQNFDFLSEADLKINSNYSKRRFTSSLNGLLHIQVHFKASVGRSPRRDKWRLICANFHEIFC